MESIILEDNPHWLNSEVYRSFERRDVLEKPDFIPYKNYVSYLSKLYDAYLKLANPDTNKKIYFFIDEIQIFQNLEVKCHD